MLAKGSDQVVQVQALAGDIVLCSWARHLTLTVPLSDQVYKWVLVNLMLGVTLQWTNIQEISGKTMIIMLIDSP